MANQGSETTVEILRESSEGSNPLNRSCVHVVNGVYTLASVSQNRNRRTIWK